MRTLGVDLASKPKKTAVCLIEWGAHAAAVVEVRTGVHDHEILEAARCADAVGIDAPFGWPESFTSFVTRSISLDVDWTPEFQRSLSYRTTDLRVWQEVGIVPLSVAADKIALPAMRCSILLDRLGVTDRSGDGKVFEVYPAAALRAWSIESAGPKAVGENVLLMNRRLQERCPWLTFFNDTDTLCMANDDSFDALVASINARMALLGLTLRPQPDEAIRARREGWIALPRPESLDLAFSA